MSLGLSFSAFTTLHVVISLFGIVSGLIVLYGMLASQRMSGWTALFLLTPSWPASRASCSRSTASCPARLP